MESTYIDCESVEERKQAIAMLMSLGLWWHGERNLTPEKVEEYYPYRNYPTIEARWQYGKIVGWPNADSSITFDEFKRTHKRPLW